MRRTIIALAISAVIISVGTVIGARRYTQASSVTAYDADVNHDGMVNILDLSASASFYHQSAPLPTATPSSATYIVSVTGQAAATAYCDPGDEVTGGGAGDGAGASVLALQASQPVYDSGTTRSGWYAHWGYNNPITTYTICLDRAPYHMAS